MREFDPDKISTNELHQLLVSAVSPRPIALASTMDENGVANLAPYSFFNVFSSNPPIMVFSSNRRRTDNTTKDTLHNIRMNKEVVINVVSFNIVRQTAVTSMEWDKSVSEFEMSGLTPVKSVRVAPFRVKESPVQFECKVEDILPLGEEGGAGHLIICRIVHIHARQDIFDEEGRINPHRLDLVGRMGRAFYGRVSGEAVYRIYQPLLPVGIGYPSLPASARNSTTLTANELGQLAGMATSPTKEQIDQYHEDEEVRQALQEEDPVHELHLLAGRYLEMDLNERAAALVWLADTI